MIGGPLLLIAALLAAAIATFLLRRFRAAAALIAALVPLALAVVALSAGESLGEPRGILGRPIALGDGDRIGMAYLFVVTAAILIAVWRSSPGWSYYPLVLLMLGALATALIVRPPLNEIHLSLVYSALFLAIAAALAVFPLQGGRPGVTGGALRFVALMALALPALLMADWSLSQLGQSPDSPELKQATTILVALGFTLLLAVVPFHTWLPTVAREAPPLSTAFVLNVFLGAAVILLADVLDGIGHIGGDPATLELLRGAGLLMAGVGGLLAWAQADFGRLLGYAALADMGAILFGVGLASSAGLTSAFVTLVVRAIGIGLMAMGRTLACERLGDDSFATLNGLVWRLPWAALAIIAGGLSLAGLPPLAGFAGRWGLVQAAGSLDPRAAVVFLLASASIAFGVLRGLREMLHPGDSEAAPLPRERRSEALLVLAMLALCLLIGLFPGALAPLVREFTSAYAFAGQ
jgi:formate hydrogenlyase subunit 3/multisubunit Na+/H+ antiporter MnhD subunit